MSNLVNEVPEHWRAMCKPYLQRASEFESKEPLIAYYLKTYVAFICLNKRTKEDKVGTQFLMKLLDLLEAEKKNDVALKQRIDESDGRTVLTKFALMLFAKADDEERTGKSDMAIVKLFFASACLFEATAQFTEDKKMDNIAAEKAKYAKYIAVKMKKCLDSGVPYVSQNKIEEPFDDASAGPSDPAAAGGNGTSAPSVENTFDQDFGPGTTFGKSENTNSGIFGSMPPSAYIQKPKYEAPPPTYSTISGDRNSANNNHNNNNNAMPPAYSPPPPQQQQQQQAPSYNYAPPPQQQQQRPPQPQALPPRQGGGNTNYAAAGSGKKVSVDNQLEAQKFVKQAISALQFYDAVTARKMLAEALSRLN